MVSVPVLPHAAVITVVVPEMEGTFTQISEVPEVFQSAIFIGEFLPAGGKEAQVSTGAHTIPIAVQKSIVAKSGNGGAQGYKHGEVGKGGGTGVAGQGKVHPEGEGGGVGDNHGVNLTH